MLKKVVIKMQKKFRRDHYNRSIFTMVKNDDKHLKVINFIL
jgi:hypothetical protein